MKLWITGYPANLRIKGFANTYTKNCRIGLLFGYDNSTYKIGKQMTKNWCESVLAVFKVPWTIEVLSKDRLRTILKATFYPHDFIVFKHWFNLHNALF